MDAEEGNVGGTDWEIGADTDDRRGPAAQHGNRIQYLPVIEKDLGKTHIYTHPQKTAFLCYMRESNAT